MDIYIVICKIVPAKFNNYNNVCNRILEMRKESYCQTLETIPGFVKPNEVQATYPGHRHDLLFELVRAIVIFEFLQRTVAFHQIREDGAQVRGHRYRGEDAEQVGSNSVVKKLRLENRAGFKTGRDQ